MWVKFLDIPMAAFTSDGLSIIASKFGITMLLNSYTNTMCEESWGRNSYARVLIKLNEDNVLKDRLVVVVPLLDKPRYTCFSILVEYEWTS